MENGRNFFLTIACVGLLSTAAMGMPSDEKSTPTDPMGQTSSGTGSKSGLGTGPGMGSGSGVDGSATGSGSGMGSGSGVDRSGTGSGSGMDSASGMGTDTDRQKITGEILRVQDELYVVKDPSGKEISLHVDSSTQQSGKLKEGDRIEAEISSDGHAFKLKKAKDMK